MNLEIVSQKEPDQHNSNVDFRTTKQPSVSTFLNIILNSSQNTNTLPPPLTSRNLKQIAANSPIPNELETVYEVQTKRNAALLLATEEFDLDESNRLAAMKLQLEQGADPNLMTKDGSTLIAWASRLGMYDIVCLLLNHGADPNILTDNCSPPLHLAVQKGHTKIIDVLLKNKANVNAKDSRGQTALLCAIKAKKAEAARQLLENSAHPNLGEENGSTPLVWASKLGMTDIVCLLLNHGADPNPPACNDGKTPLHLAAQKGLIKIVDALLKKKAQIDAQDSQGQTALLCAIKAKKAETARQLLENGANHSLGEENGSMPLVWAIRRRMTDIANLIKKNLNLQTALFYSIRSGNTKSVQELLKNGVNPNLPNQDGHAALQLAIYVYQRDASYPGKTNIVYLLINHGVNLNSGFHNNFTPLHIAAENGCTDIVNKLLEEGADINVKNKYNETPLIGAITNICEPKKGYELAARLLKKGADPNCGHYEDDYRRVPLLAIVTEWKRTDIVSLLLRYGADPIVSLHWAAKRGNTKIIEGLLKNRANIDAQDSQGRTALFFAVKSKKAEAVKQLLKNGADRNIANQDGDTPLKWALKNEMTNIAKLLKESPHLKESPQENILEKLSEYIFG